MILGVPSIWWIDLQIDGVKKGYDHFMRCNSRPSADRDPISSLAKHHKLRLPQPGSIIASSHTSPIDALYLAAIFDPIFTASYPSTRLVRRISLFQAILRALQYPQYEPPTKDKLVDLQSLLRRNPNRVIAVFPECTTTNGRGILPFSGSLLTAPADAKIFPLSLRYTPSDISTPVPNTYLTFLWNLLSKPTHCIRVRIAESVHNTTQSDDTASSTDTLLESSEGESNRLAEKKLLDKTAEALARLGRVKRVGLGVAEKVAFLRAWSRHRNQ